MSLICSFLNFELFQIALAGLDFSAIQVPGGSAGSPNSFSAHNPALGGSLQNPISIGMNDDPAIVRDTFFKNPDQLALVSFLH